MWVEKHLALLLNQYDMNKQTVWGYNGEQDLITGYRVHGMF